MIGGEASREHSVKEQQELHARHICGRTGPAQCSGGTSGRVLNTLRLMLPPPTDAGHLGRWGQGGCAWVGVRGGSYLPHTAL